MFTAKSGTMTAKSVMKSVFDQEMELSEKKGH